MRMTFGAVILWLVFHTAAVQAGTIRADVDDIQYTNLSIDFPSTAAIGLFGDTSSAASGVLIAPQWILTAAHSFLGHAETSSSVTQVQVNFGSAYGMGPIYTAESWYLHPDWVNAEAGQRNFTGADIALIRLSTPVMDISPSAIFRGQTSSLVGQQITSSGYGQTGDGNTGEINGTYGVRRAGDNVIDGTGGGVVGIFDFSAYSSNILLYDFDDPANPSASVMGSATPLLLEYMIARGDSGGPSFFEQEGKQYAAGITALLFPSAGGIGAYGSVAGLTSVSAHQNWILATIPEPASAAMLIMSLTLLCWRGRQAKG